ncbi:MAG: hypothetical protein HY432_03385 [Candidatus Liptonbacteria bacterium]|nr:hypothetical protein [Candidatus Liptonbacteria bacterium]
MIGHEKLTKDFMAFAGNNGLANCYLFFGSPRVGKKLFAASLANFLETGEFGSPSLILSGEIGEGKPKILSDFIMIEPGKEGTIGIDEIRKIKNFLWQKPIISKRRTVVLDNSETMTGEAQNAILKIAEEPPESSLLIIIASDYERLWVTLQSRLQKVYFSPVKTALVKEWLKETAGCKSEEANRLAKISHGQPGLALAMFADKKFDSLRRSAELFLKSGFWDRRNLIKGMLENENFDLSEFLEAALMIISDNLSSKKDYDTWHRFSSLRRDATSYNVNPRLQLEGILSDLK